MSIELFEQFKISFSDFLEKNKEKSYKQHLDNLNEECDVFFLTGTSQTPFYYSLTLIKNIYPFIISSNYINPSSSETVKLQNLKDFYNEVFSIKYLNTNFSKDSDRVIVGSFEEVGIIILTENLNKFIYSLYLLKEDIDLDKETYDKLITIFFKD